LAPEEKTEAGEKERETPPAAGIQKTEEKKGRKVSSTAPGLSHRRVPGQFEGGGHSVLFTPFELGY